MDDTGQSNTDLELLWLQQESNLTEGSVEDLRMDVYGESEHAYFASLSGLSIGSLNDHKLAYYRAETGGTGSLSDCARAFFLQELGV